MRPQWLVSWLPLSSCTCTGHFQSCQPLIHKRDWLFCALWNDTSSTILGVFCACKTFCTLLQVNVHVFLRLFQELTNFPRKCSSLTSVWGLLPHALKGKSGNNYAENIKHNCTKWSHLINQPTLCAPLVVSLVPGNK